MWASLGEHRDVDSGTESLVGGYLAEHGLAALHILATVPLPLSGRRDGALWG